MVGLPYPNPSDPELQERLRFIERQAAAAAAAVPLLSSQPLAAQVPTAVPTPAVAEGAATAGLRMGPAAAAAAGSQWQRQQRQPEQQQQASGRSSTAAGMAAGMAAAGAAAILQPPSCAAAAAARPAPSAAPAPTEASRQYYEDLCMKAVNQCVGRVVRHARDYAAVLLVDVRYAAGVSAAPAVPAVPAGAAAAAARGSGGQACRSSGSGSGAALARSVQAAGSRDVIVKCTGPLAKLPGWVRESLVPLRSGGGGSFGEAYGQLARFFKRMQSNEGS